MAASPMAEITGMAVRCPHAAGRERPGMLAWGAAAADTPVGQLAGGWPTGYGSRREKAPPPWLPTVPQPWVSAVNQAAELRLCSNPPQPYAHIVILAAQKAANRHK
jgi:hypothetical protein